MADFHELSRAEGRSQQTANFRQTAPEIHVSPGFLADAVVGGEGATMAKTKAMIFKTAGSPW